MKKALIIGGTGPTGPYVIEGLLERGYQVSILHRGNHEINLPPEVEHIHADPHFSETLREGLGKRYFDVIIGMYGRLRYVAEVVKRHTPYFIAIGGQPYRAFVVGDKLPDGVPVPVAEDAALVTEEAENKFSYLMTISEWAVMEAHQYGYYDATVLRFPFIYGPRQLAPREWSIIRRALDGRKQLIIPDGGLKLQRKGYAENAAQAILLCVDKPHLAAGKIYNVGDDQVMSLREWAESIAHVLEHEFELVSVPFAVARPTRAYTGRAFHEVPDITKIKQELGYRDVIHPRQGIRRTVEWYLANPPARGGEIEQRLLDPFDYAAEDHLIQEYQRWSGGMRQAVDVGFHWRHPYDHPQE